MPQLLDFDFGACRFEFLGELIGSFFRDTLFNSLRSALDESFGLNETESGKSFTDSFDNGDLVAADSGEDNV